MLVSNLLHELQNPEDVVRRLAINPLTNEEVKKEGEILSEKNYIFINKYMDHFFPDAIINKEITNKREAHQLIKNKYRMGSLYPEKEKSIIQRDVFNIESKITNNKIDLFMFLSSGQLKLLAISFLANNVPILLLDELDSDFHTELIKRIFDKSKDNVLFNKNNAEEKENVIVSTCHSPQLIDSIHIDNHFEVIRNKENGLSKIRKLEIYENNKKVRPDRVTGKKFMNSN
jgi:hypothetical protein